jgi:hypothetical protein
MFLAITAATIGTIGLTVAYCIYMTHVIEIKTISKTHNIVEHYYNGVFLTFIVDTPSGRHRYEAGTSADWYRHKNGRFGKCESALTYYLQQQAKQRQLTPCVPV